MNRVTNAAFAVKIYIARLKRVFKYLAHKMVNSEYLKDMNYSLNMKTSFEMF